MLRNNPLWRLLPYINQCAWPYWSAMLVLNSARLIEAVIPLFLKEGIDRIAAADDRLAVPLVMILGLAVVRYAMIKYGRSTMRQQGVRVGAQLRRELFRNLQRQGPAFYNTYHIGDLMARAISDIALAQQFSSQGLRMLILLCVTCVAAVAFMAHQSPPLTMLLFPLLPVLAYVCAMQARRIHRHASGVQESFSRLSTQVIENLNGIRTIQSHAQEEREIARFERETQSYSDAYLGLMSANSLLTATMVTASGVITLIVLGFGGSQVLAGTISIGTFAAFLSYLAMLLGVVKESSTSIANIQRATSGTARLFEILDAQPEIADAADARPLADLRGAISLRALSYAYSAAAPGKTRPALARISLDIAAGETVAVMGRVGAGKSTLLRLIARLHDPAPGSAFIDGRDLRTLPLADLRQAVCLVPQDAFLFATQLWENIAFDDPARPEDDVWQAAEAADLAATIRHLSDGLDTLVGERGVTLSGGQKQRVSLARGLIRQAPILLLDDCFSAVDTQTEEFILSQLKTLRRGRTTILVSHRVSTARHADRIIILDNGEIVENGSHAQLVAQGGLYARFERLQGRGGDARPPAVGCTAGGPILATT